MIVQKKLRFRAHSHGLATLGGMLIGAASGSARAAAEGFAWEPWPEPSPSGMNLWERCGRLVWAPRIEFRNPRLWKYLRDAVPVMLAVSVRGFRRSAPAQGGFDPGFRATRNPDLRESLTTVPVGFFGMAAALASFRTLSKLVRGQQKT